MRQDIVTEAPCGVLLIEAQPGSRSISNVSKQIVVTVTPPALTRFTLNPAAVVGGKDVIGTLTLDHVAGPGGLTISLSSDHPGLINLPQSILIPAGKASVPFTFSTTAVKTQVSVYLKAVLGNNAVPATLTITP